FYGTPLRRYAIMGLVSCAVLLYEVAVTRVLSVVLWYHFVFLAVSLAMLGVGLPGVWFSIRRPGPAALSRALLVAGVSIPLSIVSLVHTNELTQSVAGLPSLRLFFQSGLLLAVISLLIPMLALGSAICVLLMSALGQGVGSM